MYDSALRCKRSLSATSQWVVFSDRTKNSVGGKEKKKWGFIHIRPPPDTLRFYVKGVVVSNVTKLHVNSAIPATTTITSTGNAILVLI